MKQKLEKQIEELMKYYHPEVEEGEESMTLEKAKRLVDGVIAHGHTEEEAFECLKYCITGESGRETTTELEEDTAKIMEIAEDAKFYARTAWRTAGHVGLLMLSLNIVDKAKKKGEDMRLPKALYAIAAILFLLDDVEVLVHEMKPRLKRRKK